MLQLPALRLPGTFSPSGTVEANIHAATAAMPRLRKGHVPPPPGSRRKTQPTATVLALALAAKTPARPRS